MTETRMQEAYEQLRSRMLSGDLPPGTRLVNRALGEDLGLSTVTVREAIHRLTSEGLVEHVPNAGAYVRKLGRREVTQLYAFRAALESFALATVIERNDPAQLRRLEDLCKTWREIEAEIRATPEQRAEGDLFARWWNCDASFHEVLIEGAENMWLSQTVSSLHLMSHIVDTKPRVIELGPATTTIDEHEQLLGKLRDSDQAGAQEWLSTHNRQALEGALRRIDNQRNDGPRSR